MTTSGQNVYNQSQTALHPCFIAKTLNILGCHPGKISSFLQPVKDDPGLKTVCVRMAFTSNVMRSTLCRLFPHLPQTAG
jgi:hypothetical protein